MPKKNFVFQTRDGVVCVSVASGEPSCPLPNIPGPNSPASIVVLPAPLGSLGITVAACNPQRFSIITFSILLEVV